MEVVTLQDNTTFIVNKCLLKAKYFKVMIERESNKPLIFDTYAAIFDTYLKYLETGELLGEYDDNYWAELYAFADFIGDDEFIFHLDYKKKLQSYMKLINGENPFTFLKWAKFKPEKRVVDLLAKHYANFLFDLYGNMDVAIEEISDDTNDLFTDNNRNHLGKLMKNRLTYDLRNPKNRTIYDHISQESFKVPRDMLASEKLSDRR